MRLFGAIFFAIIFFNNFGSMKSGSGEDIASILLGDTEQVRDLAALYSGDLLFDSTWKRVKFCLTATLGLFVLCADY